MSPSISEREGGLHRGLTRAQIVMIGLGGAIGTGLFMGSGLAIGYAGPAVILSFALAGFVALVMGFSLSEMAVVHPTAGSFGTYAETYLNPWAGFVVRYTYWISQVIAIGGEAVAAGAGCASGQRTWRRSPPRCRAWWGWPRLRGSSASCPSCST